jgi:hypothetical protein
LEGMRLLLVGDAFIVRKRVSHHSEHFRS